MRKAVFNMNQYKALGPDGFPLTFFKELWGVIKNGVVHTTNEFHRLGKLLNELNQTFIVLIPKWMTRNILKNLDP